MVAMEREGGPDAVLGTIQPAGGERRSEPERGVPGIVKSSYARCGG